MPSSPPPEQRRLGFDGDAALPRFPYSARAPVNFQTGLALNELGDVDPRKARLDHGGMERKIPTAERARTATPARAVVAPAPAKAWRHGGLESWKLYGSVSPKFRGFWGLGSLESWRL